MIVIPHVCRRVNNDGSFKDIEIKPDEEVKVFTYRLRLDIFEPNDESPSKRLCIDTKSITKDKGVINEALKNNFEQLLLKFNQLYEDN